MKKLLLIIFLLSSYLAYGQTLSFFDIDASNFPKMKAKFFAMDANREMLDGLSEKDFILSSNGMQRPITKISKSPSQSLVDISSLLVLDASSFMSREINGVKYIDIAKSAANSFIENLNNNSDCAITSFDIYSNIIQDFTKDKNKLFNALNNITTSRSRSYNAGFIDTISSALSVSKTGNNKKIIFFITNGNTIAPTLLDNIINQANEQECSIYCLILGMEAPNSLKEISNKTGGLYFDKINTELEAKSIARRISLEKQNFSPYIIEWENQLLCSYFNENIVLQLNKHNSADNIKYQTSSIFNASLQFAPVDYKFINPELGKEISTTIQITAKNKDFSVFNIKLSNSQYKISPNSFHINKNESIELTITYTAIDSNYSFCKITFENDNCEQYYYIAGTYLGYPPNNKTLKITQPLHNEIFSVGGETLIKWEGILPSDTVSLEYSFDNGQNWHIITNLATGLEYLWEKIPLTISDSCLIKISQISSPSSENKYLSNKKIVVSKKIGTDGIAHSIIQDNDDNYIITGNNPRDPNYLVTKVNQNTGNKMWHRSYGGSLYEYPKDIILLNNGNYLVVGYSNSNDGDVYSPHNYYEFFQNYDMWLIEIDSSTQNIVWQNTYGDNWPEDYAYCAVQDASGKFIVAGNKEGIYWGKEYPTQDICVVKFNRTSNTAGNKYAWETVVGSKQKDGALGMIEDKKGNIVVAGFASGGDVDVVSGYKGNADFWIIKVDTANGKLLWEKTYGGSESDTAFAIIQDVDDNYIVVGHTLSNDGDIKSGNKGELDAWVIKINKDNGEIIWEQTYGASKSDVLNSIARSNNGTYLLAGYTYSNDGGIQTKSEGNSDVWLVEIDPNNGNLISQQTFGGSNDDFANDMIIDKENYIVVAATSNSNDYDVIPNGSVADYWYMRIADRIELQSDISRRFRIVEPILITRDIDLGKIIKGDIKDTMIDDFIINPAPYDFKINNIKMFGNFRLAYQAHILNGPIESTGFDDFIVKGNSQYYEDLSFDAKDEKKYLINLYMYTQSYTLKQEIKAEVIPANIRSYEKFINFGKIKIYSDTILQYTLIKNYDTIPYIFNDVKFSFPNNNNFTLLDGGGEFILYPDKKRFIKVKYSPSDTGRTTNALEFHYYGIGSPLIVQLYGEGISDTDNHIGNLYNNHDEILNISPNPSDGNVEISINLFEEGTKSLKIYDYNGAIIEEFDLSNELGNINLNLNTQKYSNGLYFVHLQTPTIIKREKLIINR